MYNSMCCQESHCGRNFAPSITSQRVVADPLTAKNGLTIQQRKWLQRPFLTGRGGGSFPTNGFKRASPPRKTRNQSRARFVTQLLPQRLFQLIMRLHTERSEVGTTSHMRSAFSGQIYRVGSFQKQVSLAHRADPARIDPNIYQWS